ncbi:hypothetical protein D3C81_1791930 [compost metagenome]
MPDEDPRRELMALETSDWVPIAAWVAPPFTWGASCSASLASSASEALAKAWKTWSSLLMLPMTESTKGVMAFSALRLEPWPFRMS